MLERFKNVPIVLYAAFPREKEEGRKHSEWLQKRGIIDNEPPHDREPQGNFCGLHGILLIIVLVLQLFLIDKVMRNEGNNNRANPLQPYTDTCKIPNQYPNESSKGIYRRMFQKNQHIGLQPSANMTNHIPSALLWDSEANRDNNLQIPRQREVLRLIKNKTHRPNKTAIQEAPNIWADKAIPVNHFQI
ncbi:hypothetical protein QQ054_00940 [Oscillatoria amoena NRMC-F 0135]|nr:hypothetical protein [Oscillatoria amoena NRMC-F 0135]